MSSKPVNTVEEAVSAFRRGEFVMVMDRMDRENECDLVLAGDACTPDKMAFMIEWSTGIICVVTDKERLESVGLYPAAPRGNTDKNGTNFYVSTDYLPKTTTGVSAQDRCETVLAFCDEKKLIPGDFSKPGHMFPLCARPNGLYERDGHTESAYDLCRLAGVTTVSIIGEMMHRDGTMMRMDDSVAFAKKHGIPLITVPELKTYLMDHIPMNPVAAVDTFQPTVELVSSCQISLAGLDGECTLSVFRPTGDDATEIVAIARGDLAGGSRVPLRIHSECFTGDILGSLRCDCGSQLSTFVKEVMNANPVSCLLYIRGHEGRGIGLANKIKCYRLQDEEQLDTVDANIRLGFLEDLRTFAECGDVLKQLGVGSVALYTNNPEKAAALGPDMVASIVPLPSVPNGVNNHYLLTKQNRMKHQTVIDTMKWNQLLSTPRGVAPELTVGGPKIALVAATWNDEYVSEMMDACLGELKRNQATVEVIRVPGATDLCAGVRCAVKRIPDVEAVIAIGVLIKGNTDLYENNCQALAAGIAQLNCKDDFPPVVSGLLMYKSEAQANSRLETAESTKLGVSWAKSAVSMARVFSAH